LLLQRRELLNSSCNIFLRFMSALTYILYTGDSSLTYLGKLFSFGELFVNLLGEVLVRLQDLAFRHGGGFMDRVVRC
jgi:hypothetical protein